VNCKTAPEVVRSIFDIFEPIKETIALGEDIEFLASSKVAHEFKDLKETPVW